MSNVGEPVGKATLFKRLGEIADEIGEIEQCADSLLKRVVHNGEGKKLDSPQMLPQTLEIAIDAIYCRIQEIGMTLLDISDAVGVFAPPPNERG